jgi:hypothetical protein
MTLHEHCHICEWLGREAERTALELGRAYWVSETNGGPDLHRAIYEKEATS